MLNTLKILIMLISFVIDAEADSIYYSAPYEYIYVTTKKTWSPAKADCEARNGVLVKIGSENVAQIIRRNLPAVNGRFWIGLTDATVEGEWRWLADGAVAFGGGAYTNWDNAVNEPNGGQRENCAAVDNDGQWMEAPCYYWKKYICQRKKVYVENNLLLFSYDSKTWTQAKAECEKQGMRLVKMDSDPLTTAVTEHYGQDTSDREWKWIGADDIDSEGDWRWLDGTSASRLSAPYHKWNDAENEPNGKRTENCAVVDGNGGWIDVNCQGERKYICQQANVTAITLSITTLTIGISGDVQAICSADGVPLPIVFWKFTSKEVTDQSSGMVYQAKSNGRSVLHVGNASLTDEGTYTCVAENLAGNFSKTLLKNFTLTVPSTPEFVTAEAAVCSPAIDVRWKPNSRAWNISHKISIRNERNASATYELIRWPKNLEAFTVIVEGWMYYSIKVTPCPKGVCKNNYAISNVTRSPTVGRPRKTFNLSVEVLNKYSCLIKWLRPNDRTSEYILNYQITVRKRHAQGSNATESIEIVPQNETTYFTEEKANMQYDFGIQAETCAGVGEIVWSTESCVTDAKDSGSTSRNIGLIVGFITLILLILIGVYVKKNSQLAIFSCVVVRDKTATTSFDNISRDASTRDYETIDFGTKADVESETAGRKSAEPSFIEPIIYQPNYENSSYENRPEVILNPSGGTNVDLDTAYTPYMVGLQLEQRPDGYDAINIAPEQDQSVNVYSNIWERYYEPVQVTRDALP